MSALKLRFDCLAPTDRDFVLLRGLFECRVMTAKHVATLYFDGKKSYTTKRLQKLKAAGLVGERKRRVNERSILFLTRKAFNLLKTEGRLQEHPPLSANSFVARANVSEMTLRHELEVMDVKAAFHSALNKSEKFSILKFSTWPLLYQFEVSRSGYGRDGLMRPDGFICIQEKEAGTNGLSYDCFLEVDRSHEHHDLLVGKARSYLEFYKSGGYAVRNGASRSDVKDFPFRALMVLKTAARRNNTAERLVQNDPPILTQTWLTTFAEVTTNPLGAVWIRPAEYREVTKGTRFYNEQPNRRFEYRPQPERDKFVETKIRKRHFFED
jgi:hypothetical protein